MVVIYLMDACLSGLPPPATVIKIEEGIKPEDENNSAGKESCP
jgi:hypothetical protein